MQNDPVWAYGFYLQCKCQARADTLRLFLCLVNAKVEDSFAKKPLACERWWLWGTALRLAQVPPLPGFIRTKTQENFVVARLPGSEHRRFGFAFRFSRSCGRANLAGLL